MNFRSQNGVERRLTIGTHRDPWLEKAARKRALQLKAQIDQGADPMAERHERREAPTIADLIELWRKEHSLSNRLRTREQNEITIRQWIKPALGTRKVVDVQLKDVAGLHRKITAAGTAIRANRVISLLSKMFSLAVEWKWCADNPCRGVKRNAEEKRDRHLSRAELPRLLAALALHSNKSAAAAILLCLLTGCRKGEALSATWSQFDFERGRWIKPASSTKQKRTHIVPLSEDVRKLLDEHAARPEARNDPQLFPGITDLKTDWARLTRAADLHDLRLHDLRHSFASMLVDAGEGLPMIGSLLGHSSPATTARYVHLYDDTRRAAVEKVAGIVSSAAPKGEVVPLPRKGARS